MVSVVFARTLMPAPPFHTSPGLEPDVLFTPLRMIVASPSQVMPDPVNPDRASMVALLSVTVALEAMLTPTFAVSVPVSVMPFAAV